MSSWVETQPPPSTGLLVTEMVRPSGSSIVPYFDLAALGQLGGELIGIAVEAAGRDPQVQELGQAAAGIARARRRSGESPYISR